MSKPLVTVISTNHLAENFNYLDWSLKSILSSVDVDFEVLCFSSAKECPEVDSKITLIHDPVKYSSCSAKFNAGVKMAHPNSKYICMVADDVMISKYLLMELSGVLEGNELIIGPASNCDSTTRYHTTYFLGSQEKHIRIGQKSSLEDIQGFEQNVIDHPRERRVLIDPGWISFYCTMMSKKVIDKVGLLDERMDVRWNDYQYCERARKLGIPSMIDLGTFALHFGDKTLPKCVTKEQYDQADKAFGEWIGRQSISTPEDHGDTL